MFSHFGLSVTDLPKMVTFYRDFMGFTVTDRGEVAGLEVVFLSRDPLDHHQIVLATGRPKDMPGNTGNPMFGPCINQISFRMASIADLRDMRSEEHTSELQSLMRISYAVFCLKKKKQQKHQPLTVKYSQPHNTNISIT